MEFYILYLNCLFLSLSLSRANLAESEFRRSPGVPDTSLHVLDF